MREFLVAEQASVRRDIADMNACFAHSTPAAARESFNPLAARGMINKGEIHHLSGKVDGDKGRLKVTHQFISKQTSLACLNHVNTNS